MTRILVKMSKIVVCLGVLATGLVADQAQAQVVVTFGPPVEFIATSTPVYYEGRPSYWYRNRWYYRHGNRWATYRSEPHRLREHRMRRAPVRYVYTRGHPYRQQGRQHHR